MLAILTFITKEYPTDFSFIIIFANNKNGYKYVIPKALKTVKNSTLLEYLHVELILIPPLFAYQTLDYLSTFELFWIWRHSEMSTNCSSKIGFLYKVT